jgi:hypothetical protein
MNKEIFVCFVDCTLKKASKKRYSTFRFKGHSHKKVVEIISLYHRFGPN